MHRFSGASWSRLLPVVFLTMASLASAQAPIQTFYVPLPEQDLLTALRVLDPGLADTTIRTTIGITAAGDNTIGIPFSDRNDEIGALARSICVFQNAMRKNEELNRTIVDDADLRARRQERMSDEIAQFSGEVEATLAELGRISDEMLAASAQLAAAADNASTKTTQAEQASSEASANVRDIASAADELSASVNEIDRQVAQSNTIATKAVNEVESTNVAVKELDEAAARIGDVVKLITDIAEQTNLLALNATIEAARRELEEEVGTDKAEFLRESREWFAYDLPRDLAKSLWKGRFRGQAQRWVAMRFVGRDSDIDIATKHPEFQAWRWARARELPGLIVPFKRDVYRAVLEEFADLVA